MNKSHEQFVLEMSQKHPDIVVLGHYVNRSTPILVRHVCGYEWETKPSNLLLGHGCPYCNHSIRKTNDQFINELSIANPDIIVLGEYIGNKSKILVKSKKCGHEWMGIPYELLNGAGCPYCSGRLVLRGFNDLATTQPWMVKYFVNIEDTYTHTACSHSKVLIHCPDCGHETYKQIKSLYMQGFGCPNCSDGISYPNKFIRALIEQISLTNYEFEYSPDWIGKKRYDVYFEYNNMEYIIEMDGDFHYKDVSISDRSLDQIVQNDKYKDDMAKNHNIDVIRIDSRKSEVEYLKSNIISSKIADIFDLSNIDWKYCGIRATSNYIKEACDYYNTNKFNITVKDMATKYHVHHATFRRYMNIGKANGWIIESDEEEQLIKALNSNYTSIGRKVAVFDYNFNFIRSFNSILSCSKYMNYFYSEHFDDEKIRKIIDKNINEYNGFYFYNLCDVFPDIE